MRDKIGQAIEPGAFIAYGHSLSRSAALRIGRVEAIDEQTQKITVRGVDDDWNQREPRLLGAKSTLFFPNRTIVLPGVPDAYSALFNVACANGTPHQWVNVSDWKRACSVCKTEKWG